MSIPERIKSAVKENGYQEDIGNVLANTYRYMERKQWWSACHATCAALYVSLSELGYEPTGGLLTSIWNNRAMWKMLY